MLIAALAAFFLLAFIVTMLGLPLALLRLEVWSARHGARRFDPEDFLR